jgi:hypothetical protein
LLDATGDSAEPANSVSIALVICFLLAACCGRDIHHSAREKQQIESAGNYASVGSRQTFLMGDKLQSLKSSIRGRALRLEISRDPV